MPDELNIDELNEDEQAMVELVRDFVNREVRPAARDLEHANTYPDKLIEQMKQLGIYGLAIPEPWGDAQVSTPCYARITEELARGWMSLAGAMGGHTVVAKLLLAYGTDEQKGAYLPRMATGELRATMALTEPGGGSDLQAMRTVARRDGTDYVINGSKMWITNARRSGLTALLCKTDPAAKPAHAGISIILAEPGPGFTVSRDLPKLGYKGVESCELSFEDYRVPASALLGGREGEGFGQMMRGLEIGRIQVASRALGVGQAALDDSLRYAQQREAFGVPIWKHQSIGNYLADMVTKLTAARQLVMYAARCYDSGRRADMEVGMAKLFASETAHTVAVGAMRVHGETGTLARLEVERHYRDTPLMIIGEGTNEIQRTLIARQLLERYGERIGGLLALESEPVERRQMLLAVRQFVEKEIAPRPESLAMLEGLVDLGLLGAVVPVEHGGLGLDLLTSAMIVEEIARGSATVAGVVAAHLTAAWAFARFGDDAQRSALARLTRAETVASAALAGTVTARRERTECVLTGMTTLADHAARADVVLVRATTEAHHVVVAVPQRAPGLRIGQAEDALGARGAEAAVLHLDGVRVPLTSVLGAGDGREDVAATASGALARL